MIGETPVRWLEYLEIPDVDLEIPRTVERAEELMGKVAGIRLPYVRDPPSNAPGDLLFYYRMMLRQAISNYTDEETIRSLESTFTSMVRLEKRAKEEFGWPRMGIDCWELTWREADSQGRLPGDAYYAGPYAEYSGPMRKYQ